MQSWVFQRSYTQSQTIIMEYPALYQSCSLTVASLKPSSRRPLTWICHHRNSDWMLIQLKRLFSTTFFFSDTDTALDVAFCGVGIVEYEPLDVLSWSLQPVNGFKTDSNWSDTSTQETVFNSPCNARAVMRWFLILRITLRMKLSWRRDVALGQPERLLSRTK